MGGGKHGPLLSLQFFWILLQGKGEKVLGMVFFLAGWGDSVQGERKGRLGKSYVDGACGGWGESLWSAGMIGICVYEIQKGWMCGGIAWTAGVEGIENFFGA